MRVEPSGVDSIVHVVQRGTRGSNIVRDDSDRFRFVRSLLYLNDEYADPVWHETVSRVSFLERPRWWPERDPLVRILAWTLLPNHFHLLVQEIKDGGTAKFMQRLCGSMTMCFNKKYQENGSLFQGSYRAKVVADAAHLNYLPFYILVKNTFDVYPGGVSAAVANFDAAWQWVLEYPFSSASGQLRGEESPIINDPSGILRSIIGEADAYKTEAQDLLMRYLETKGSDFSGIMLEDW